ncbi:MAG: hypothetical protein ACK4KV_11750 [Rhodocyclaceae bacterium]
MSPMPTERTAHRASTRLHHLTLLAAPLLVLSSPLQAETWLVLSGASHHFRQDERDWREVNPGLGLEVRSARPGWEEVYYVGGYFRNSYDKHALYAGARWMPWGWKWDSGSLKFGGYALASTGYPSPVLVLPGFSVEWRNVGMNIVVAPNVGHYSGYVGMQLRVRLND